MTRVIVCFAALLILFSCGSSNSSRSSGSVKLFAKGPIYSACKSAGRKKATKQRCGCVKAIANKSLTANDQRRGASFFKNPQKSQEVRQSSSNRDKRFWKRWKEYSNNAARSCS